MSPAHFKLIFCAQRNSQGLIDLKGYDDALLSLYIQFRQVTGANNAPEKELRDNFYNRLQHEWIAVLLAIETTSQKLIGYIALSNLDEETMQLTNTFVLPTYRHMGIFTNMYDHVITFAKEKKSTYLCVETTNPELQTFFQQQGFTVIGESALLRKKL